ncbi:hypothetical protein GCM10010151_12980 [Actinoallomurus spadix]|uniref:Bulb-type lectin domain-containing protein n=1 Tax=Actinoallomurus spadix TaxID=79912 RepID=A0ABN0W424_9ACTN
MSAEHPGTAADPVPDAGSLTGGNQPPGGDPGTEPSPARPMAKRPVLAAAVAGSVALLAGAVLLTGTTSHRDTTSWTASTFGGGQSPTSVELVSSSSSDDLKYKMAPGLLMAPPEEPDGSGPDALVVMAPHYFSYDRREYPGAVKTKHLALSMDQAGVLSLVGDRGPWWSPNLLWSTDPGARGSQAVFQTDGNLVVYDRDGTPVWASGTDGNPGARLVLQADNNLVIYAADGRPLWAAGTNV